MNTCGLDYPTRILEYVFSLLEFKVADTSEAEAVVDAPTLS